MRTISETMRCELSESELNERAQQMSSKMLEYDELEDQKKSTSQTMGERMKTIRGQMRELSEKIRSKSEFRLVECQLVYHTPEPGMKRVIRQDTGELLRDEQMTSEERQTNLYDDVRFLRGLYENGPDAPPEEAAPEPQA